MIQSSYRNNGNTHKAFALLEEYLHHNGSYIEKVNLAEKDIGFCRGCRTCFDQGETLCPLKDDVLEIYDKMKANDIIVIGGPIYVDDVNGLLKNWIDRMAFNSHRPGLYRQKYFVFMNSGVGASRHAVQTVERAFNTWGMRRIGERRIVVGAHIDAASLRTTHGKTIESDAKKISDKAQQIKGPSFLQIMTFYIQKWYYQNRMEKDKYDYWYWRNNGWLDKHRNYYSEKPIGFLTALGTKLAGFTIIKLILK